MFNVGSQTFSKGQSAAEQQGCVLHLYFCATAEIFHLFHKFSNDVYKYLNAFELLFLSYDFSVPEGNPGKSFYNAMAG